VRKTAEENISEECGPGRNFSKLSVPSHSPLFKLTVFRAARQLTECLEEANFLCIYYVYLADHQAVHYHYHYHGKKAPVTTAGEIFIKG